MKKVLTFFVLLALLASAACAGVYMWHTNEMEAMRDQLTQEQAMKERMDARLADIQSQLDTATEENQGLLSQISELMTEEVAVFDSAMVMEEILEIGELSTVEYRYTNVGTLDASSKFSFVDWTVPLSSKTIVATMDGIVKVGIDVSQVTISSDEASKVITVSIPTAKILSNELFENSLKVYVEEESMFSNIKMEDTNAVRSQIKEKAEQNAKDNGVLEQAYNHAKDIIQYMIESIPSIKDTYTIEFKQI